MKDFTVKKLFKIFLTIFVTAIVTLILFFIAVTILPANHIFHDCKPKIPKNIPFDDSLQKPADNKQAFCPEGYVVGLKESWNNNVGYVGSEVILLSGFMLIPTGAVLILRKLENKK